MIEYTVKVYENGSKSWYLNGELHREDGPAIERSNGTKFWYRNGELHREDGPAIEYFNGLKEWHLHGKEATEEEVMGTKDNKPEAILGDRTDDAETACRG